MALGDYNGVVDKQLRDLGGPAFPQPYVHWGMTLRDYFAGCALVGIRASEPELTAKQASNKAYKDADKMIDERGL